MTLSGARGLKIEETYMLNMFPMVEIQPKSQNRNVRYLRYNINKPLSHVMFSPINRTCQLFKSSIIVCLHT